MIDEIIETRFTGSYSNKKQIILSNTNRGAGSYLASLNLRYNGKYDKIPHYLITKNGDCYQTMDDVNYSKYFGNELIDKKSIHIVLENMGWVEYDLSLDCFKNWMGKKIEVTPYIMKWRDYDYWDIYTDSQMEKLYKLSNQLCEKMGIPKIFIGHNTKENGVEKFNGIVSRSNYDVLWTDINPAFDFQGFKKRLEDE